MRMRIRPHSAWPLVVMTVQVARGAPAEAKRVASPPPGAVTAGAGGIFFGFP